MANKNKNLDWLVAARGYAMYGVFLTHMMAAYISESHFENLKAILQFSEPVLLPFFAILTGAFYSRSIQPFSSYIRFKFSQRIFPVYLYLLLIIPFYFMFPVHGKTALESLKLAPLYLVGIPFLSWPSWFLVALFTSELLYYFIQPLVKNKTHIALLALLLYSIGWLYQYFILDLPNIFYMLGMIWMLQATFLFCAFFLVGALIKPYLLKMTHWSWWQVLLCGILAIGILYFSVTHNSYRVPPIHASEFIKQIRGPEMIVISTGQYGNYFLFILSTLAGAFGLLCFARLMPVTKFMRACGDHSLVLLGLNGIFQSVLNFRIAAAFLPVEHSLLYTLAYSVVISALSIAISLPVAILLEKYLPQLTGRPMFDGPLLPALYRKSK